MRRGDAAGALDPIRRALALQPDEARVYNTLGAALAAEGNRAVAMAAFAVAIRLRPDFPDPWNNAGNVLQNAGDPAAADLYRHAVALLPGNAAAYVNLAEAVRLHAVTLADHLAGWAACRRALELAPDFPPALNAMSVLCLDLERLVEAEAGFRYLLDGDPDNSMLRFNLALVLLKTGRLREGWAYYEDRWRIGEVAPVALPGSLWSGEPVDGRSVLLYAEQGFGDTMQFIRYAPLLAARGARVHVAVPRALKRLLERIPGLEAVHVLGDSLPQTDFHCPMLSLPRAFGTELDTIPAAVPYLSVDPEAVARWRARLPAGFTAGLVWAGDPRPHTPKAGAIDRRRSLPLAALEPLADVPGVTFVSLQKGTAAGQARLPGLSLIDWMDEVEDFADTAALISALDLVIAVDTAVVHLAGALGKPVWVLSRYSGCWRWLTGRPDSPWYPGLRLFRQTEPGNWAPVVAEVAAALAAR